MNELNKLIAALENRIGQFTSHLGKDLAELGPEVTRVRTEVENELAALLAKLEAL